MVAGRSPLCITAFAVYLHATMLQIATHAAQLPTGSVFGHKPFPSVYRMIGLFATVRGDSSPKNTTEPRAAARTSRVPNPPHSAPPSLPSQPTQLFNWDGRKNLGRLGAGNLLKGLLFLGAPTLPAPSSGRRHCNCSIRFAGESNCYIRFAGEFKFPVSCVKQSSTLNADGRLKSLNRVLPSLCRHRCRRPEQGEHRRQQVAARGHVAALRHHERVARPPAAKRWRAMRMRCSIRSRNPKSCSPPPLAPKSPAQIALSESAAKMMPPLVEVTNVRATVNTLADEAAAWTRSASQWPSVRAATIHKSILECELAPNVAARRSFPCTLVVDLARVARAPVRCFCPRRGAGAVVLLPRDSCAPSHATESSLVSAARSPSLPTQHHFRDSPAPWPQ